MKDKITREEFLRSHDHRFHGPGAPPAPEIARCNKRLQLELTRVLNPSKTRIMSDRAWIVMLHRQAIIQRETAARVLKALEECGRAEHYTGEDIALKKKLDGDEDAASFINLGRTTQEPMSRMQLREKLLDVLDTAMKCLDTILDVAEANVDTIMAGYTHLSHAQPITYAAYLLSVHDALARGLELLELAYKHVNECSAGCGAVSGTGWPVDRYLVAELLGFDRLVEPTYDCEAGQDHALTALFGVAHVMLALTQTTLDHGIWGLEELGDISLAPEWLSISSMMPQKAHVSGIFESIRVSATEAIGEMVKGVMGMKAEPHEDALPVYLGWRSGLRALCYAERALGLLSALLPNVIPDRERMLHWARQGFAAAPDLAVKLIREKGYGGRRAWRVCATFVRTARERGIKPYECTSELLDEAARFLGETPPGLTTEEVREMLDPVQFIQRHNNVGDPHPDESRRMIAKRRETLASVRKRHDERVARIKRAEEKLAAEVKAIVDE